MPSSTTSCTYAILDTMTCVRVWVLSCSVTCNSLQHCGLQPARLLWPWDSPDWSGFPFPFPGNRPDLGIEPELPALALQFFNHWAIWEAQHWPVNFAKWTKRDRIHRCQCHSGKKSRNKKGASLLDWDMKYHSLFPVSLFPSSAYLTFVFAQLGKWSLSALHHLIHTVLIETWLQWGHRDEVDDL